MLAINGKRRQFVRSFTKKNQKVLMKIEEMADIFLNSANFAPHALLTLAPPSGYALNLKALIKVSEGHLSFHMKYRIVASTNTCYYSENQIFYSLE